MTKIDTGITTELRCKAFERDHYTCRYCGSRKPPFHADHVYPFSKDWLTVIGNLVTTYKRCNLKKK